MTQDEVTNIVNQILREEKDKLIKIISDYNKMSMNNFINFVDLKQIFKYWRN